jgi:hypothetical protein
VEKQRKEKKETVTRGERKRFGIRVFVIGFTVLQKRRTML